MMTSTRTIWPDNIHQPEETIRVALVGAGARSRTIYKLAVRFPKP